MVLAPPLAELLETAQQAAANSYSPYSSYAVGAAVRWQDGSVSSGSNVENCSFGLSLCAERAALVAGASRGQRVLQAVAVWVAQAPVATPCGACLQVMQEFAPSAATEVAATEVAAPREVVVVLGAPGQPPKLTTLGELFPLPFRADLDS